jgi:hypothetical protein
MFDPDSTDLAPHSFRPCAHLGCNRVARDAERCTDHDLDAKIESVKIRQGLLLGLRLTTGNVEFLADANRCARMLGIYLRAKAMQEKRLGRSAIRFQLPALLGKLSAHFGIVPHEPANDSGAGCCHICQSTPIVARMECRGLGLGPVCEQCEEIETERAARDQAYEDSRSEP